MLGPPGLALAFWIPTCWYLQREMVASGSKPTRRPSPSGFVSQWNIGSMYLISSNEGSNVLCTTTKSVHLYTPR